MGPQTHKHKTRPRRAQKTPAAARRAGSLFSIFSRACVILAPINGSRVRDTRKMRARACPVCFYLVKYYILYEFVYTIVVLSAALYTHICLLYYSYLHVKRGAGTGHKCCARAQLFTHSSLLGMAGWMDTRFMDCMLSINMCTTAYYVSDKYKKIKIYI